MINIFMVAKKNKKYLFDQFIHTRQFFTIKISSEKFNYALFILFVLEKKTNL